MTTPYPGSINLIQDGEAVNAAITNSPLSQLDERTESLREKVDNGLFGSNRVLYNQPTTSNTVVGTPVFLDNDLTFKQAVFQYDLTIAPDYNLDRASYVVGLIGAKTNSTLADVLLSGLLTLTSDQLIAITQSGTVETGQLFLSPSQAGKLTTLLPPIGIPVAFCAGPDAYGNYKLLVSCNPQNLLYQHIHYRVSLTMAATNPTVGTPTPGWVNTTTYASWFTTNGITIPAGATYYYLHTADPQLNRLWPPQPLSAADLERNGIRMRIDGANRVAILNYDGIWYLSATYAPTGAGNTANVAAQFDLGGFADRIDLLFIRLASSTQVVTSITNDDGTLEILNATGTANASSGALLMRAKLPLNPSDDTPGSLALKLVDNGVQNRGVVLEGIKVDPSSGLMITGGTAVSEGLDGSGDPISPTGYLGGRLIIGFTDPNGPYQGTFEAVSFDNVDIIDNGNGVFGWTFHQGLQGTIQGRFRVPTRGVPGTGLNCQIELVVLGLVTGQLPVLTTTLRILTQPVETAGDPDYTLQLPSSDTSFDDLNLGNDGTEDYTITAGYYVKRTSDTFLVHPGDLVVVSFMRTVGDGYSGDLSVLDMKWVLSTP